MTLPMSHWKSVVKEALNRIVPLTCESLNHWIVLFDKILFTRHRPHSDEQGREFVVAQIVVAQILPLLCAAVHASLLWDTLSHCAQTAQGQLLLATGVLL